MGLESGEKQGRQLTQDEVFAGLFRGGISFTLATDFTLKNGRVLEAGQKITFAGLSHGVTAVGYGGKMEFVGHAKVIPNPPFENGEYDVADFIVEE